MVVSSQFCQDRQDVVVEHHICKAALQVKIVEVAREIVVPQSQAGEALPECLEPHLLEVGHSAAKTVPRRFPGR